MWRLAHFWRNFLTLYYRLKYRKKFSKIGTNLTIWGDVFFSGPGKVFAGNGLFIRSFAFKMVEIYVGSHASFKIGDHVVINQGVRITAQKEIIIGNNCLIGDDVVIIDSDFHGVGNAPAKTVPINIGNDVWIASRAMILKGVQIGDHSVIGAGAVVTKSIPSYSFAAGVPAVVLRKIEEK